MIKLFTMVKDENDIIRDWIVYHGSMFGFDNLYIIDNFSTDGTYEIIEDLRNIGIHIYRMNDYKRKGEYMKQLIDENCSANDIAFPIDIDEFIVYYDNNKISINKTLILSYMNTLPVAHIYKANYINPVIKRQDYNRIITECESGNYADYKNMAKTFFNNSIYLGPVDHGNHIMRDDYLLTKICLVHYHFRNLEQIKKKILNNILGLNYINNLEYLENLSNNCAGNHHVQSQIKVLKNEYSFQFDSNAVGEISLKPLQDRILGGFF